MDNFLIERTKSVKFALRGAYLLLKTEHAIISQFFIGLIFIAMGFYFKITRLEWVLQLGLIAMVLTAEGLNTAIEQLCDHVNPTYDTHIGFIKDVSSGAVAFAAIFALISSIIIYYPYVFAS